jgi:asparagine synthase (glutamine-hydrolysing)
LCGILAYYSRSYLSYSEIAESIKSLNSIRHRGPDGEGVVLINTNNGDYKVLQTKETPSDINIKDPSNSNFNLLIGHRRLKIIDLTSSGHQPMEFLNNWISYNGEIYNYLEIKKELQIEGYNFNSSSDTEIVLKAYHFWGKKCLEKFNGMWSFIIWDNKLKSIFISNDRFGVKPLYVYKSLDKVIYTSEIKQFHFFNEVKSTINDENCNLYLDHGYQPLDGTTYFNEINRFPAGSFSLFNFSTNENIINYYSIQNIKINDNWVFKDAVNTLGKILSDAVSLRYRSDVELGISISGGIDSSLLVQYGFDIHQLKFNKKLKSFSAVSPNMKGDESEFIREVLKNYDLDSHFVNPYEKFNKSDFLKFITHLEFPPSTTSFYAQWLVSKLMSQKGVKVNLVGQGADEVFGGYHSHYFRYFRTLILKGKILLYFSEINAYSEIRQLNKINLHKIVLSDVLTFFKYKSELKKLDNKLLNYWYKINDLTSFLKSDFSSYQLPFYLHSDDRNSMSHSVETRHPFLDYRIVEFGYSLPNNFLLKNGWSKYILRKILDDSLEKIKWRKDKKGYTVPDSEIMRKFLPDSKNLNLDFKKFCLKKIIEY